MTRPHSKLILGGPGSGKTHRLLEIMSQELDRGVPPERIAFVSFTKKAAREAATRACAKFDLTDQQFPYCRTLHSLAYQALGLHTTMVVSKKHMKEFGPKVSCTFSGVVGDVYSDQLGDRAKGILDYVANTQTSLREVWHQQGDGMTWPWIQWFRESYERYKETNCLVDFSDMLEMYLREGLPVPVDVAIIDEAQDLSRLQWQVTRRAFAETERVYIGGDYAQAIYTWMGADIQTFLNLKVDETESLPKSHRLTPAVLKYSQTILHKLGPQYERPFAPETTRKGRVKVHAYMNSLPLDDAGTWLLLARTHRLLKEFKEFLESTGHVYSTKAGLSVKASEVDTLYAFEDARAGKRIRGDAANDVLKAAGKTPRFKPTEHITFADLDLPNEVWHNSLMGIPETRRGYYLTARRRGESLRDPPRIHVGTIHSVKGGEADNVAIVSDMGHRVYQGYVTCPEAEYRVWYVGTTRTRGNLHILAPRTTKHFLL